jgi:hypothetical protein
MEIGMERLHRVRRQRQHAELVALAADAHLGFREASIFQLKLENLA